jgi:hypothetical protein
MEAKLCINGYAGRREIPVLVVGETRTKYRVQLTQETHLPGARVGQAGDVVLVPKYAIKELDYAI